MNVIVCSCTQSILLEFGSCERCTVDESFMKARCPIEMQSGQTVQPSSNKWKRLLIIAGSIMVVGVLVFLIVSRMQQIGPV